MTELINRIKTILWISDSEFDPYLGEIVPALLAHANTVCNQTWDEETVPSDVVLFISQAAEYFLNQSGLSQETLGDWSASYAASLPQSIQGLLTNYRKVSW